MLPLISAKEGIGIEDLLEKVVETIPAPSGDPGGKLKALISIPSMITTRE